MELTNPRGPASGLVRPASSRAAIIRHRQTNTSRQANTETHNVDRQNKRQNTNTDRKTNIYKYNGIIYTIACSPSGTWDCQRKTICGNAKKEAQDLSLCLLAWLLKLHPGQARPLQPLSTLYHRTLPGINGPWERLFLKLYLRAGWHNLWGYR